MSQTSFTTNTAASGGAIYAQTLGNFSNVSFTGNSATGGDGGAVRAETLSGAIDTNSSFLNNTATGRGGAIYAANNLTGRIADTLFQGNRATGDGGAIYAGGGNALTIDNVSFSENQGANGGAMFRGGVADTVWFARSSFYRNTATANGGALYFDTARNIQIQNSSFEGNAATGGDGGAIRAGTLSGAIDTNSSFRNNTATGRGGAIYAANDLTGRIADTLFQGNRAAGDGGAIYAGGGSALTIDNVSFFENQGANGGAMFRGGVTDTALFTGSGFYHNTATANGGALYFDTAQNIQIQNAVFEGNTAAADGGAVYFNTNNGTQAYNVFISADPDTPTFFINNAANGTGNSFHVGGSSSAVDFNLNIAGNGMVSFYDPFTVAMNGTGRAFTMTMNYGDTSLLMSGENTVSVNNGTADINLMRGNTLLRSDMVNNQDFTMKFEGATRSSVTLGSGHALTLMALDSRDPAKPLFDFTGVTGGNSKTFTAQPGTVLDITRILSPLPATQRYLLAAGFDSATAPDVNNFVYLHPDGYQEVPTLENGNTELWLDLSNLPDAFDPKSTDPNVLRAKNCLAGWLNNTVPGLALTPDEVIKLRRNWSSATAEAYVSAVNLGFDIHSRAMEAANRQAFAQASAADIASAPFYFSARQDLGASAMSHEGGNTQAASADPSAGPTEQNMPDGSMVRLWTGYFGAFNNARDRNGYSGYDTHTNGFLVGAVWDIDRSWSVGGYGGYSHSSSDFDSLSAKIDTDSRHFGVHVNYRAESGFKGLVNAGYTSSDNDSRRHPGRLGTAKGSFDQEIYSLGAEAAWDFYPGEYLRVTPMAGLTYMHLHQDGVQETGFMPVRVDSVSESSLSSTVGASISRDFLFDNGNILRPELGAAWKHEFGDVQTSTHGGFLDPAVGATASTSRCSVKSRERSRDAAVLTPSLMSHFSISEEVKLGLKVSYTLELRERETTHGVFAGAQILF